MLLALALVAVLAGAGLQRMTGLGFALVSGPVLVLLLDPINGISLANLLSAITAVTVLATTWRHIDWRLAWQLSLGIAIAVVPGALVVHSLPRPWLLILVGALTAVAVAVVMARRPLRLLRKPGGAVVAGLVSGFSNVTAGVGGPALAVYGASTDWHSKTFVPTVQVSLLLANVLSLVSKQQLTLPPAIVLAAVGAVVAGILVGSYIQRWVDHSLARRLVLVIALIGALASAGKGLFELLS
ncbi:sulfite exporter TauE/SafE family protein [Glaciibacter superstes]|uniref:sulfite exporter TauE/SafE family protein n=1 Tax=Glaciibacter superstes TaxID=501023 RepID=UPI0003B64CD8|nr:sulfite exporter TauE/SafE family protein [Glaciibacter superstes]